MKAAQGHLLAALEREAEGQRLLLAGDDEAAAALLREVSDLYRRSWEEAPPAAYGRLAGMLKAAILAGDANEAAAYACAAIDEPTSPAAAYVLALAALAVGDDESAAAAARAMEEGDDAFRRAAAAIAALAAKDRERYAEALEAIVRDFEARETHLTGVAIADTALVLERLAGSRAIPARPRSSLLPSP